MRSERVAVKMETDTIPVIGVEELGKHLDELHEDPSLPLNAKLFDHVELQLTGERTSRRGARSMIYRANAHFIRREYSSPHTTTPPQHHRDPQEVSARPRSSVQPGN